MYAINLRKHNNFKVNKMNNIHVLPTDKPSTLFFGININQEQNYFKTQNLFITSEEEIREGDWFIRDGSIHKCFRVHKTDIEFLTSIDSVYCGSNTFWGKEFCKKIILTTDQYLIKDGVQSIDDEFLQWFIKNPSCEEVRITTKWVFIGEDKTKDNYLGSTIEYKIIIPSEEPKQIKCYCGHTSYCDCSPLEEPNKTHYLDELPNMDREVLAKMWESAMPTLELKQETIEEFISEVTKNFKDEMSIKFTSGGIKLGAKWQQERMYSEEEVLTLLQNFNKNAMEYIEQDDRSIMTSTTLKKWFEQFKKK